ncbi:hypothetical protein CJ030_MR3G009828 [Morella rubra]|uniref:Apple domain-containing protein n=1 Tax=Morella rubra TaxID=262757 RepID=A0A6A1W9J6_9ROSI|nr:hypothetical protein CJ030_MR3G009828 [Morella rubra]
MAQGRGRWGCSYKKTTLVVCSINIVIALYVLRSLYSSLYIYSGNVSRNAVSYTPDQISKMEESIRIRRAFQPVELGKLVKKLKVELSRGDVMVALPRPLKQKITDEILERLKSLNGSANVTEQRVSSTESFVLVASATFPVIISVLDATTSWRSQKLAKTIFFNVCLGFAMLLRKRLESKNALFKCSILGTFFPLLSLWANDVTGLKEPVLQLWLNEAVESWCREKLEATKQLTFERGTLNSTILQEEAGMLVKALESDWAVLLEEIGLWIPSEVINKEHDDKPEGEEELEDEILAGRPLPPQCHAELHTDYDGSAVRWGLTHHKESAADCCQACLDHAARAKPGEKKCNIWVYCPSEDGCHSPDIYQHKHQECWLKYAENPKLNFKDKYPESYRNSHPTAPFVLVLPVEMHMKLAPLESS